MNNIIYSDKKRVDKILDSIKKEGLENLYILADFDRTMTYSLIDWKEKPSLISVLRNNIKYLWKEYSLEAKELFDYYHPIEVDINRSIEEKCEKMSEWRVNHLNLLVKSGLNKSHIEEVANSWIIRLRWWIITFLKFLDNNNIPLIILSANGLWWDSITAYLKHNKLYKKNIEIVSNRFLFDESWKAVWYDNNVIHTFNKGEVVFKKFPRIEKKIKNRKNILLLWDSLWDPNMADWAEYNSLLKIWFYNESTDDKLSVYLEKYDILLTGDSDWDFLNNILTLKG